MKNQSVLSHSKNFERKSKNKKIGKLHINKVNNLVNILSKLLQNAAYGFQWPKMTSSG